MLFRSSLICVFVRAGGVLGSVVSLFSLLPQPVVPRTPKSNRSRESVRSLRMILGSFFDGRQSLRSRDKSGGFAILQSFLGLGEVCHAVPSGTKPVAVWNHSRSGYSYVVGIAVGEVRLVPLGMTIGEGKIITSLMSPTRWEICVPATGR